MYARSVFLALDAPSFAIVIRHHLRKMASNSLAKNERKIHVGKFAPHLAAGKPGSVKTRSRITFALFTYYTVVKVQNLKTNPCGLDLEN